MSNTAHLALPYILAAQAQKHVTHNEALRALDALVQLAVLDRNLAAPPGSPGDGDRYIVAAGATGAWTGHTGKVAAFQDGAWAIYPPQIGWRAWVADEDELYVYDGATWQTAGGGGGASVNPAPLVGVNATADTSNRLSVNSPAVLFNHEGAGHQIKVNKNAGGDTASLLFQTGFSGRAEMGTTGDDSFHVKTSANGSAWMEALVADAATGTVFLPRTNLITVLSADFNGANSSAVQPVFATGQDELTVVASTAYEFEALYNITRVAGTTSHTSGIQFGGTATLTSIDYLAQVSNPTGNALAAVSQIMGNAATLVTLTAANTVATEHLLIRLTGIVRVNAAGTLIPQFKYSAAPGGAPIIKRGSYFKARPLGAGSVTVVGPFA